jgi:hypothetical protein
MPETSCPSCATPVEFPPELAGKKFTCMKCDHTFRLPGDPIAPPTPANPSQLQTSPAERRPDTPVPGTAPASPEEQARALALFTRLAAEMTLQDIPRDTILVRLTALGCPPEMASTALKGMDKGKANAILGQLNASAGYTNILFGSLWLFGGLIVTGMTYAAAVSSGGGRYVVATGAIIVGAFQVLRGLGQLWSK